LRAKGIYLLYRVLQTLAWPAVVFYFALRAARSAQYRESLAERFGMLPSQLVQTVPGCIWLHAVSVGEIIASIELVRRLRRELPKAPVYVSAGTLAGHAMAREKLSGLAAGVFYAPVDYVFAVRRALRALKPSVVVVLETEIWPNLFREARRSGATVVMVNARISDRTARRYARFRWFFSKVLEQTQRILAQSAADRDRFLAAGAPPERIEDGGNLKYDFEPREAASDSPVRQFLAAQKGKRVWIAASTTADDRVAEEDAVLEAFAKLQGWVLILAPRKPDRFDEVAGKIAERRLEFVRRTEMDGQAQAYPTILLLDTIGELAGLFSLADVVFMGGTLADRGGHNILEPAFSGKPVITGPHLENFREIAADFRAHDAIITVDRAEDLAPAVLAAADDTEVGQRARTRAAARRGATDHAVRVIREFHCCALPLVRPNPAARFFFAPLTWMWRRGGEMRAEKALYEYRRIDAPVISVGNITTGGTGKTPFVAWLTRRLKEDGHRPGILTRGYGRRSHENIVAIPAGGTAEVSQTGDEAQIYLRAGTAALGIAANRYTAGLILRGRFGVDIFVLDDGFQHRQLRRDVDIVLIDGLKPFGNGELMPLGRLREPMEALARADAFVITRSELSRITPAIERKLREYNAAAPVFRAATMADQWVEFPTGHEYHSADLAGERVIAFCGLGNPESFWQTLASLEIRPLETLEYDDHHAYTTAELRRLVQLAKEQGATLLLTTEKDSVNLCQEGALLLEGVKLLWLKIDFAIDDERALMGMVGARLAR
jgi:3-deoxy-D-manno-octulosonic-acid transferase